MGGKGKEQKVKFLSLLPTPHRVSSESEFRKKLQKAKFLTTAPNTTKVESALKVEFGGALTVSLNNERVWTGSPPQENCTVNHQKVVKMDEGAPPQLTQLF